MKRRTVAPATTATCTSRGAGCLTSATPSASDPRWSLKPQDREGLERGPPFLCPARPCRAHARPVPALSWLAHPRRTVDARTATCSRTTPRRAPGGLDPVLALRPPALPARLVCRQLRWWHRGFLGRRQRRPADGAAGAGHRHRQRRPAGDAGRTATGTRG